jgi:hypothetical protein
MNLYISVLFIAVQIILLIFNIFWTVCAPDLVYSSWELQSLYIPKFH